MKSFACDWISPACVRQCVCAARQMNREEEPQPPPLTSLTLSLFHKCPRYPEIFQKSPRGVVCASANVRISSPGQEEMETEEINKLDQN